MLRVKKIIGSDLKTISLNGLCKSAVTVRVANGRLRDVVGL